MLFRFSSVVYVAGPSSPDGRPCFVLAKKSQELCGLCYRGQPLVTGKLALSPWVAPSQIHFPTLLGVSSNDFPPQMMGVGVAQRHKCACLLCKKALLRGQASYFSPRFKF